MPVPVAAAAVVLALTIAVATPSRAADCDCTHLAVLQAELRNALRLQGAFRGQIAALRGMGAGASQGALQGFAAGDARRGLEAVPGGQQGEVDYVPYGQDVAVDRLGAFNNDRLCAMRPSSAAALETAVRAAACDGIGRALRAHEGVHVTMCRSTGYRAYIAMHGADRAAEEAEAYGAQITALRAEIIRVLERLNPRIQVTSTARVTGPPNPLFSAIVTEVQAELRMTRAVVVDPAAPLVRFDGQGQQSSNSRVEGSCRFTAGMPITLPVTGGIETDGLVARITYAVSGTSPTVAMQCQVPGGGRGTGMTMPAPMSGGPPGAITVPLRNGAEEVTDMATVPAAAILAQGGMRLTGEGRFRLVLDCP